MRLWQAKALWVLPVFVLLLVALRGVNQAARLGAAQKSEAKNAAQKTASEPSPPVPPYFKSVEAAKPLPAGLPAERFKDRPVVERAYQIAHLIPKVLAQEPCYCGCNTEFGHRSLLDCYASDHTAGCAVCVKEAFLAYELHRQGKTPAQIRAAIMRGEWKAIDMAHPPELRP